MVMLHKQRTYNMLRVRVVDEWLGGIPAQCIDLISDNMAFRSVVVILLQEFALFCQFSAQLVHPPRECSMLTLPERGKCSLHATQRLSCALQLCAHCLKAIQLPRVYLESAHQRTKAGNQARDPRKHCCESMCNACMPAAVLCTP